MLLTLSGLWSDPMGSGLTPGPHRVRSGPGAHPDCRLGSGTVPSVCETDVRDRCLVRPEWQLGRAAVWPTVPPGSWQGSLSSVSLAFVNFRSYAIAWQHPGLKVWAIGASANRCVERADFDVHGRDATGVPRRMPADVLRACGVTDKLAYFVVVGWGPVCAKVCGAAAAGIESAIDRVLELVISCFVGTPVGERSLEFCAVRTVVICCLDIDFLASYEANGLRNAATELRSWVG